jgi:hypothetical protein
MFTHVVVLLGFDAVHTRRNIMSSSSALNNEEYAKMAYTARDLNQVPMECRCTMSLADAALSLPRPWGSAQRSSEIVLGLFIPPCLRICYSRSSPQQYVEEFCSKSFTLCVFTQLLSILTHARHVSILLIPCVVLRQNSAKFSFFFCVFRAAGPCKRGVRCTGTPEVKIRI